MLLDAHLTTELMRTLDGRAVFICVPGLKECLLSSHFHVFLRLLSALLAAMLLSPAAVAVAAAFVTQVAAHGYVPLLKIGNEYIQGWNIPTGVSMHFYQALSS
jgi:hypothetical protein